MDELRRIECDDGGIAGEASAVFEGELLGFDHVMHRVGR